MKEKMKITDIEQDLKVIRKAMESSLRYTNIPVPAHFAAGLLGILGVWGTYLFLGKEKVANVESILPEDASTLAILWGVVFVAALGCALFFSWQRAQKHHISAWNSLAARMFLSQVPLLAIAGVLTLGIGLKGYYDLIPGLWLSLYGVILFSFSYFTGIAHRVESICFLLLGIAAAFASGPVALVLLGLGFGGVHIAGGLARLFLLKGGGHESE